MPAKRRKNKAFIFGILIFCLAILGFYQYGRPLWVPYYQDITGRRTLEDIANQVQPQAEIFLKPAFAKADVPYPPKKLTLLAFKAEKRLELWALKKTKWVYVTEFEIKAASGKAGPKLQEGNRQVPEGIYRISGLNPNSHFYLSLKINYPNEFDLLHARLERRLNVGGDIFIHGKSVSIGCLAIGDHAVEQLFILVSKMAMKNVNVIIAPRDFRRHGLTITKNPTPPWLPELYTKIDYELKQFAIN